MPLARSNLLLSWCTLRLRCNDLVTNLLVGGGRNNALCLQVGLRLVRTPGDDLRGVGVPDSRQRAQFLLARRVDVDQVGLHWSWSSLSHHFRWTWY
jgi:hypothetical protein